MNPASGAAANYQQQYCDQEEFSHESGTVVSAAFTSTSSISANAVRPEEIEGQEEAQIFPLGGTTALGVEFGY